MAILTFTIYFTLVVDLPLLAESVGTGLSDKYEVIQLGSKMIQ